MNPTIISAIDKRLLLNFQYKGTTRTVEPHTYGVQHNGNESISAWQRAGGSGESFRLFKVDEMLAIDLQEATFDGERPGYHQSDQRYAIIFAEL